MWVSVITSVEGTVVTIRTTTFNITRSCILSTESVHGFHVSLRTNSSYFASAVTRFLVFPVQYEPNVVHYLDKFRASNVMLSYFNYQQTNALT